MITSPLDYYYILVPQDGSMRFDGGIMPFRDGQEKRSIRGEDIAFCLEGAYERAFIGQKFDQYLWGDVTDRQIKAERWKDAADVLHLTVNYSPWFKSDAIFTTIEKNVTNNPPPSQLWPEYVLTEADLKSDSTQFNAGGKLYMQPILDVFDDLNTLHVFENSGIAAIDFDWTTTYIGDGRRIDPPFSPYVLMYQSIYNSYYSGSRLDVANNNSVLRFSISDAYGEDLSFLDDYCTVIVGMRLTWDEITSVDPSARTRTTTRHVEVPRFFPCLAFKTSGGYNLNLNMLLSAVRQYRLDKCPADGITEIGYAASYQIQTTFDYGIFQLTDRTYWQPL